MLAELLREILKLKRDRAFGQNLFLTIVVAIVYCTFLAQASKTPTRLAKREKIGQFSHKAAAGMVIKTYRSFLR